MKHYQPLLLSKLEIDLPGLHIRQLELHRHLSETASVHPHQHPFAQYLCYLNGEGRQEINGQSYLIRSGTAVYLPPGTIHAFRREGNRRPICLAVDFNWPSGSSFPKVENLPTSILRELRQHLSRLGHLTAIVQPKPNSLSLSISSEILSLLDLLLHRKSHAILPTSKPVTLKVHRLLEINQNDLSPREIAEKSGYHYDSLNRRLRAESGLTFGQLRNRRLLQQAMNALRAQRNIGDAAEDTGFKDPNYFSRWFQKQTGLTPTKWRNSAG